MQINGCTLQRRGTARTPLSCPAASPMRLAKFAYLQFATEAIRAQNPDSQPTKVYPSHNVS